MMNLDNFPGGMMSGVDDSFLDFFVNESSCRYITELDDGYTNSLNAIETIEISEEEKQHLIELEKECIPMSTQQQTNQHIKKLKKFLTDKGLCTDIQMVPEKILCDYLRLFYSELRTDKGGFYSPSSLICFRASIQRYLSSPEVNCTMDIIHGNNFKRANGVLRSMVGRYLQSNQRKNEKFQSINEEDMDKMKQYFQRNNLQVLQDEVLFNTIFHFGLRGRENLRSLTYSTFEMKTDDSGARYLHIAVPMMQKNVKASLNCKDYSDYKQARMYEVSDKHQCPLQAFFDYQSHFEGPKADTPLFLKVGKNGTFSKQVIGKCTLGDFMKNLSKKINLQKMYTNHCIRVTVVTVLKEQCVADRDVMLITGHKNSRSIERYERKRRDRDFRELSIKLSSREEKNLIIKPNGDNAIQVQNKENSFENNCVTNEVGQGSKKAKLYTSWGFLEIDL